MKYKILIWNLFLIILLVSCKKEAISEPIEEVIVTEDHEVIDEGQIDLSEEGIISTGEIELRLSEKINQLKAQLQEEHLTVEKKRTLEAQISSMIYEGYPFYDHAYGEYYYPTPVNKACNGYATIGDDELVWCELDKNMVIEVTGQVSVDWFTARMICEQPTQDLNDFYLESDRVEFLIHRDNLAIDYDIQSVDYGPCDYMNTPEYKYIIEDDGPLTANGFLNEEAVADVYVYELPDENSKVIGFTLEGDVVRKHKDAFGTDIETDNWVFVETIPFYWTESRSGWVKKSQVRLIESADIPNSGFVLRGTILYNGPSKEAGVFDGYGEGSGLYTFADVNMSCVAIHSHEGDWYGISDGLNGSFYGYVKAEEVLLFIDEEDLIEVMYPTFDPKLFINYLQMEIKSNPDFRLEAKDMGVSLDLTSEQRVLLAYSFTWIDSDIELFDGGISGDREANYPYYCLDFGDSKMVITGRNQLLLFINQEEAFNYGLGTDGAPVRFITPNIEFIETIVQLLPAAPNDDIGVVTYLLGARTLTFGQIGEPYEEAIYPEQINKVVRGLDVQMGNVLPADFQPDSNEDKYGYVFGFDDGSEMTVIYTDTYILYKGIYYGSKVEAGSFYSGLFAAYF